MAQRLILIRLLIIVLTVTTVSSLSSASLNAGETPIIASASAAAVVPASASSLISDSSNYSKEDLCYLSHGGSSETFTVSEALPVNSVIGVLQVIGNASSTGDIELSIDESRSTRLSDDGQKVPIEIEPGTKRLVLVRELDKEGADGDTNLVVGIKCSKRKYPSEPSIIIPVRLIVTDSNDNVPVFVSGPYETSVSEITLTGTPIISGILATDADQQGPYSTVEYYVEPGPFSHLVRFANQFEGTIVLAAPLDYETLPKFWVTLRAQDQGDPPNSATTTLTVNVIDADDQNPRFDHDKYTATLPESPRVGEPLQVLPAPLHAIDPDEGIRSPISYSFNTESKETQYFAVDERTGEVSLTVSVLPPSVQLPITLVMRGTQMDNKDRYALTTLTVFSRKETQPTPKLAFTKPVYQASLLENQPPGHSVLTLQLKHFPSGGSGAPPLQYQLLDDDGKYFSVKNTGEIILEKSLDYELKKWHAFRVLVTDGSETDTCRVNVTVINLNDHDPQFNQNHYVFYVSESKLKQSPAIGEIHATDMDYGESIVLSIDGPHSRYFQITSSGQLKVKKLKGLNTTQCHLIVVATDSGKPPRSSSVSVTVHFSPQIIKNVARSIGEFKLDNNGLGPETGDNSKSDSSDSIEVNMYNASGSGPGGILNASSSSAIVIVTVLGVLLATLFIIIITLTIHVIKHRKYGGGGNGSSRSSSANSVSAINGASTASLAHHAHQPAYLHGPQYHAHGHLQNGGPNGFTNHCALPPDSMSSRLSGGSSSANSHKRQSLNKVMPHPSAHPHHHQLSSVMSSAVATAQSFMLPCGSLLGTAAGSTKAPPGSGVENPIFCLPKSSSSSSSSSNSANNNNNHSTSGKNNCGAKLGQSLIDPDSAIASDASSSNDTHGGKRACDERQLMPDYDEEEELVDSRPMMLNCRPCPRSNYQGAGGAGGNGASSSTISRISVIKWPQGSIPRRVKKLTWEDERQHSHLNPYTATVSIQSNSSSGSPSPTPKGGGGRPSSTTSNGHINNATTTMTTSGRKIELDPDVSVTPLKRTPNQFIPTSHATSATQQHNNLNSNHALLPDLTVYF